MQKRCKCGNFASFDGVCHWCRDREIDEKARREKYELEQNILQRPFKVVINEKDWNVSEGFLKNLYLELAASPSLRNVVSFSVTRR